MSSSGPVSPIPHWAIGFSDTFNIVLAGWSHSCGTATEEAEAEGSLYPRKSKQLGNRAKVHVREKRKNIYTYIHVCMCACMYTNIWFSRFLTLSSLSLQYSREICPLFIRLFGTSCQMLLISFPLFLKHLYFYLCLFPPRRDCSLTQQHSTTISHRFRGQH